MRGDALAVLEGRSINASLYALGEVVRCLNAGTRVFGTTPFLDGGQAEAAAVPVADHACMRIPDGVSTEQAVLLTDILPTGFFGARLADIRPGDTVAIIGAGPVGIQALLSAQLYGPARVLQVDRVQERLALAQGDGGATERNAAPVQRHRPRRQRRVTAHAERRGDHPRVGPVEVRRQRRAAGKGNQS